LDYLLADFCARTIAQNRRKQAVAKEGI